MPVPMWRYFAGSSVDKWSGGALGGLIVGWTYLPIALWIGVFGAAAGFIAGGFGGATSSIAQTFHIGQGVGFGAAIVGLFVGAFSGVVLIYSEFYNNLSTIVGSLVSGMAVGFFTLWLIVSFEDQLLRLRGYREPSRREKQLIDPIVDQILQRWNIVGSRPVIYVSDSKEPAAWTHAKSIVIAVGLLGSYDDSENPPVPDMPPHAFAAVLAHEMCHWVRGDGIGIRAVWACCWPIVVLFNVAAFLGQRRQFVVLGWLLFWPAWVSIKLVVIPMLTKAMRASEYEADRWAASLGDEYRAGLRIALGEFADWEAPRTGWEDVLHATHPPIEHRLQRVETPPPPSLTLHADGIADLTVTDPEVINAHRLYSEAYREANAELVPTRERELWETAAAWLRRVKHAKEQGEQTDVARTVAELDGSIADLDYKAAAGMFIRLEIEGYDDIVCRDPAVMWATRLLVEAGRSKDLSLGATREHEQLTAIIAWLRNVKQATENGEPADINETVEGLDLRIRDLEQKAAIVQGQADNGTYRGGVSYKSSHEHHAQGPG